jgi:hypothetical protein
MTTTIHPAWSKLNPTELARMGICIIADNDQWKAEIVDKLLAMHQQGVKQILVDTSDLEKRWHAVDADTRIVVAAMVQSVVAESLAGMMQRLNDERQERQAR